ncbi:hypothetical protein AR540_23740 [Pseudomonas sp. EpS/L25]|nr:hypothetical protein AR540_23740 [Pseudomonas sp. EpS/L25]
MAFIARQGKIYRCGFRHEFCTLIKQELDCKNKLTKAFIGTIYLLQFILLIQQPPMQIKQGVPHRLFIIIHHLLFTAMFARSR